MALFDDIFGGLRGLARADASQQQRSMGFVSGLPPIAQSILQNEAMSMGYSDIEEAMRFQPGIMQSRATELAKYYPEEPTRYQPPMGSDRVERIELPNPAPRTPVRTEPSIDYDTNKLIRPEELRLLRLEERRRQEEDDRMAERDLTNAMTASGAGTTTADRLVGLLDPSLKVPPMRPLSATDAYTGANVAPPGMYGEDMSTLLTAIDQVDPAQAEKIRTGIYDAGATSAELTASAVLGMVSPPVLAFLANRFLKYAPEVAAQIARHPVRGKLLRDELGRFISRRSVGPMTEAQTVARQFGSTGAARRRAARQGTEYDPKMAGPGDPTAMARGGNIRQAMIDRYNRMY